MADRSGPQLLAGVLVGAALFAAVVLPVPYVILSPGPVFDTLGSVGDTPVISVTGAPTYPTTGRLDLTTVSESGGPRSRVSLVDALRAGLDPDAAVVPTELLYPAGTTADQVDQEGAAEMASSQDAAEIAALRQLGLPVTDTVVVSRVDPDGPSATVLERGDRIRTVDGVAVDTPAEVKAQVDRRSPGDVVVVGYERDDRAGVARITAAAADDDPAQARIGVVLGVSYDSPVEVDITLEDVGGPSAGLMFSLGIVDRLTAVQETGGAHVAGTGTIDAEGLVGAIGGVQQKLAGARDAGATVFLVPAGNCADARASGVDGVRLVRVTSLDTALDALATLRAGRTDVPAC